VVYPPRRQRDRRWGFLTAALSLHSRHAAVADAPKRSGSERGRPARVPASLESSTSARSK
jgi:hypothetical protein